MTRPQRPEDEARNGGVPPGFRTRLPAAAPRRGNRGVRLRGDEPGRIAAATQAMGVQGGMATIATTFGEGRHVVLSGHASTVIEHMFALSAGMPCQGF